MAMALFNCASLRKLASKTQLFPLAKPKGLCFLSNLKRKGFFFIDHVVLPRPRTLAESVMFFPIPAALMVICARRHVFLLLSRSESVMPSANLMSMRGTSRCAAAESTARNEKNKGRIRENMWSFFENEWSFPPPLRRVAPKDGTRRANLVSFARRVRQIYTLLSF